MVMVIVLAAITTSLVFATFLLSRSVDQSFEKKVTVERTQLELLCLSAIEAAKLKIRTNPTELYLAFKWRDDILPIASRTAALYQQFINDLNLELLDKNFANVGSGRTAKIIVIERLGLTKKAEAVSEGYTEDYFRIVGKATSEALKFADMKNEFTMNVTIQMKKYEDL